MQTSVVIVSGMLYQQKYKSPKLTEHLYNLLFLQVFYPVTTYFIKVH
jgi:hypothetical protein